MKTGLRISQYGLKWLMAQRERLCPPRRADRFRKGSHQAALRLAGPLVTVMLLLAVSPVARGNAAVLPWHFVSAATGSDAGNDCRDQYSPCATIQHAIDESNAGDRIIVRPGTYTEQLVIPTRVNLEGPKPERKNWGPSATIDGGAGSAVTPETSGITIGGFTISSAGTPIRTAGPDVNQLKIVGNIIEGGGSGIRLEAGGESIDISLNDIDSDEDAIRLDGTNYSELKVWFNRLTVPNSAYGIFSGISAEIDGLQLEGNEFGAASFSGPVSNGSIWGNEVEPPAGEVGLVANLDDTRIMENTINGGSAASCLQLLGDTGGLNASHGVLISRNEFSGCQPYAIQLGKEVEVVSITGNTFPHSYEGIITDNSSPWNPAGNDIAIFGNRFVGLSGLAIDNPAGGTLDARHNWWGCNAGPSAPGCDRVGAGVTALPNVVLTAEASEDPEKAWTAPINALNPGGKAFILAYLKYSDGGEALNVPTDGTTARFSSPMGTLWPASSFWHNARVASGFTAGSQPGPAGITVAMDNQQVVVPLTILGSSSLVTPTNSQPVSRPGSQLHEHVRLNLPRKVLSLSSRSSVLGTLSCAQSGCQIERSSAVGHIGARQLRAQLLAPAGLPAEGMGQIRLILPKWAFRALSKDITGMLRITIEARDGTEAQASIDRLFKIKVR